MGLSKYKQIRDFKKTPEPTGGRKKKSKKLSFVVQRHDASRLHYDVRLEMEGVLKSWAVPKGPSMKAGDKRLAVMIEDHPIEYGDFYGVIPEGNYGAGVVDIWDNGSYEAYKLPAGSKEENHLLQQLHKGDLKVVFHGQYLKGAFAFIRLKDDEGEPSQNWLLIKKNDEHDVEDFNIEDIAPLKTTGAIKKKKTSGTKPIIKSVNNDFIGEKKIIITDIQSFTSNEEIVKISDKEVKLTNLNKIFWPDEGFTKGDLIKYYLSVSNYILPYLKNRPQSLNRFPNGIKGPSFYHKDMEPAQLPKWIKTEKLYSKSNDRDIDYLICNNSATLAFMINMGCIEINPWHSTYKKPDHPDYMMLDLDPGEISFKEVVNTALVVKELCDELGINAYCKTSGATGLHVYIPLGAKYEYDQVKTFAELLANITHSRIPSVTTIERKIAKRNNKIYIDFLQNRKGQTIVAPYSVRPRSLATVSTPLKWSEVNETLSPEDFNIKTMVDRLQTVGDIWIETLKKPINLSQVLTQLEKLN